MTLFANMQLVQVFEILMLMSFGLAWPFSIARLLKKKDSTGKSVFFLVVIIFGYICGVFFKFFGNLDKILFLYIFNAIMVSVDLFLTLKYRKK